MQQVARRGFRWGAVVLTAAALGGGCKKNKELLVLASLTTPTTMTGLSSVAIKVGETEETFTLTQLSATAVVYGVYVPDDVPSPVTVQARAKVGANCAGLAGSGAATLDGDGGKVDLVLTPGNTCGEPPPSLSHCKEYDHDLSGAPCDTEADDSVFVRSVAFSPDGHYFATAGSDGRVKIWTFDGRTLVATGKVLEKPGVLEIAFSPDGKLLAIGSINDPALPIDLYDVGSWTRRRVLSGPTSLVIGVGFSPDGKYVIALETDGYGTNDLMALPVDGSPPGPTVSVEGDPWWLAVAPTAGPAGTAVAIASSSDEVVLLSFANGKFSAPAMFSATGDPALGAWAIGFSPDGSLLAAGGDDNAFHYWNVPFQSATPASSAFTVGKSLTTLAFSPSNEYVAVAAGTNDDGEITMWDLLTGTLRASFATTYAPFAIAYAPSGNAVAGGEDDCGKVFLCAD